jgi:hypothetical protein
VKNYERIDEPENERMLLFLVEAFEIEHFLSFRRCDLHNNGLSGASTQNPVRLGAAWMTASWTSHVSLPSPLYPPALFSILRPQDDLLEDQ